MEKSPRGTADGLSSARRRFLADLAKVGAATSVAAAMPAWGQTSEQPPPAADTSEKVSIVENLARYAAGLHYEDLPPETVRQAKRVLIDTIGCAIGGFSTAPAQIAVKLCAGVSAPAGATVLCSGHKTSPELATFANGVMIRVLDFNDAIVGHGGGHPSDTIAALLSAAEMAGRSGRDLILAIVLAYEVYCRFADVFDSDAVGMDNAPLGSLAGVIGASRLLGMTPQQTAHAASIYVAGNIALGQSKRGKVSNWKDCSAAECSRNAIFAAQLANSGMTGPERVFEGPSGFFNLLKIKPFALPKFGGGGEPFGIMHSIFKRFALGQWAQSVAEAALQARTFITNPDDIAKVKLHVAQRAIGIMADTPDKWHPQTRETADHSLPYAAAVLLTYGTIDEHYYDDEFLHDQRLLDLVGRVQVIRWAEADRRRTETSMCELEIVLKSGSTQTVRVEYQRWHWLNPMTEAEMEEKFIALAAKQLPASRIDGLMKQLRKLEEADSVRTLVEMTSPA